MIPINKNSLIGILSVIIAVLLVVMILVSSSTLRNQTTTISDSNLSNNETTPTNQDFTPTGNYLEIIQLAEQQTNTYATDLEDEPDLDTISDTEINAIFTDGGAQ